MTRETTRGVMWIGLVACLALVLAPVVGQAQNKDEEPVEEGKGYSNGEPVPNQAPANDLCADAEGPFGVPFFVLGSNAGGTSDGAPFCVTSEGDASVWYTVIGTGNTIAASTCENDSAGTADYDTKIQVYCQGCATPLCVGGNDDVTGCSLHSTAIWCSQVGVEYLVAVSGFGAATGDFGLDVFDNGTPCAGAVLCQAEGACCDVPGAACLITNEATCTASGGTYLGDGTGCFTPAGSPTAYSSSPGLPITDSITTLDTITVPDSFTVGDVNVELQIDHTWTADLEITLVHIPSGTSQLLVDDLCSGSTWDNLYATVDDEGAETDCDTLVAGPSGTVFFSPTDAGGAPLYAFDGLDAAGGWELQIFDDAAGDTGMLNTWILHIDEGTGACVPQQQEERVIPTLQGTGMAVLAVLLLGGAILVIRRRM